MTTKHVLLPLYDQVDYLYKVTLEGSSYRLRFTYNQVMQLYTMAISDADDVTLVSGAGLVPNYPIAADYVIEGLTGTFLLLPKANTPSEFYKTYPDKLATYYELSYVYDSPEE